MPLSADIYNAILLSEWLFSLPRLKSKKALNVSRCCITAEKKMCVKKSDRMSSDGHMLRLSLGGLRMEDIETISGTSELFG